MSKTDQLKAPSLNRYGSIQAHHALMTEAQRQGLDFEGRPTGVLQQGWRLYLYEDVGVGKVKARIVRAVPPLDVQEFVPLLFHKTAAVRKRGNGSGNRKHHHSR